MLLELFVVNNIIFSRKFDEGCKFFVNVYKYLVILPSYVFTCLAMDETILLFLSRQAKNIFPSFRSQRSIVNFLLVSDAKCHDAMRLKCL
jgi:hypothetical protein